MGGAAELFEEKSGVNKVVGHGAVPMRNDMVERETTRRAAIIEQDWPSKMRLTEIADEMWVGMTKFGRLIYSQGRVRPQTGMKDYDCQRSSLSLEFHSSGTRKSEHRTEHKGLELLELLAHWLRAFDECLP
jgi:hypothetical protein